MAPPPEALEGLQIPTWSPLALFRLVPAAEDSAMEQTLDQLSQTLDHLAEVLDHPVEALEDPVEVLEAPVEALEAPAAVVGVAPLPMNNNAPLLTNSSVQL